MTARIAADPPDLVPMQSPVRWALLGLVIQRPSYGYELHGRFEHAYAGLLKINGAGQIYQGLDGLEKRGFVKAFQPRESAAREPKLHYEATELGMRAYQHWLAQHASEQHQRLRLFARELTLLGEVRPDAAVEILDACERTWLEQSAGSAAQPAGPEDATSRLSRRLQELATALYQEANLSWVEDARALFRAAMDGTTPPR